MCEETKMSWTKALRGGAQMDSVHLRSYLADLSILRLGLLKGSCQTLVTARMKCYDIVQPCPLFCLKSTNRWKLPCPNQRKGSCMISMQATTLWWEIWDKRTGKLAGGTVRSRCFWWWRWLTDIQWWIWIAQTTRLGVWQTCSSGTSAWMVWQVLLG